MKTILAIGAVLVFGVLASPAMSQVPYIPLPVVVGKADRIVIAQVAEVGEPKEMELKSPDFGGKTWCRTFKAKVTREIGAAGAASKPADKEAKAAMEVLARCAPPPPPPGPGGLMVHVSDRPNYPKFQTGKSYMMILSKLPDRTEYYLPSYFLNFKADADPMVKEVEKLADLDSWPWGKEQNGLRMACMMMSAYVTPGGTGDRAFCFACVAVRNVSDKPLAVNLYDNDKCLQITATSDAGAFSTNFYNFKSRQPADFDASNTVVVNPKAMVFIGPTSLGDRGLGFRLPLDPGKYEFHATYTNSREGKGKNDVPLWKGTLDSKPVSMDVQVPRPR